MKLAESFQDDEVKGRKVRPASGGHRPAATRMSRDTVFAADFRNTILKMRGSTHPNAGL